jgi:hypothetical protein
LNWRAIAAGCNVNNYSAFMTKAFAVADTLHGAPLNFLYDFILLKLQMSLKSPSRGIALLKLPDNRQSLDYLA